MNETQKYGRTFLNSAWSKAVILCGIAKVLYSTAAVVSAADLNVDGNLTATNATFYDTNSIAPNQVYLNSNSLVTAKIGDARYVPRTHIVTTVGLDSEWTNNPPYTTGGYNGAALGAFSHVDGYNCFAAGRGAGADGTASISLGANTDSSGYGALAIGVQSTADGYASVAMGSYTWTYNNQAVAMGDHTEAGGINSVAMGKYNKAQGFSQLVIGQYNIPQGVANSWASTNILFMIGNGTATNALSNALEITGEGNTWMSGGLNVTSNALLQASVGVGTNTPTAKLHVNGTSRFETNAVFRAAVSLLFPQGDLSMGSFTNSPPS